MLRLRDIMTREVVTLEPQMTLREGLEILTARHLSGAPVISGQKLVGVISAGDFLSFAAEPSQDDELQAESTLADEWDKTSGWKDDGDSQSALFFTDMWNEHTEAANDVVDFQGQSSSDALSSHLVEEAMTKTIRCLSPDADVRSAAAMMRHYGVHRVLVVNRGRLVGLVSAMDITNAVADRKLTARDYVFGRESLIRPLSAELEDAACTGNPDMP